MSLGNEDVFFTTKDTNWHEYKRIISRKKAQTTQKKEGLATDPHGLTQTFSRLTSPDKNSHRFAKKSQNKQYKTRPG